MSSEVERVRTQLRRLGLPTMAQIFEEEAATAAKGELSFTAFLARLADAEVTAKVDRSVSIRLAKAQFPVLRTLESFDFSRVMKKSLDSDFGASAGQILNLSAALRLADSGPWRTFSSPC